MNQFTKVKTIWIPITEMETYTYDETPAGRIIFRINYIF